MELPQNVEVEMTLYATVTITQEICEGIEDQYPEAWKRYKDDPEEIAKMILYASVGSNIPSNNSHYEDIWDGVGDMRGLIRDVELG